MKYQDCAFTVQAEGFGTGDTFIDGRRLTDANINPVTGLASDYLNHFSEAIMLLEMQMDSPDFLEDFLCWRPMSYREHFLASRFKGRDLAIAAYNAADPAVRERLNTLTLAMTSVIQSTRANLTADLSPEAAKTLAERASAWLKVLVGRARAVINGETDLGPSPSSQAAVDGLMRRTA